MVMALSPYDDQQREYTKQLAIEELRTLTRALYFALGCKVFDEHVNEAHIAVAIQPARFALGRERISLRDINRITTEEKENGLKMAQAPGCSYWQQHPEAVNFTRLLIQNAPY
jgi:hypothetical protein